MSDYQVVYSPNDKMWLVVDNEIGEVVAYFDDRDMAFEQVDIWENREREEIKTIGYITIEVSDEMRAVVKAALES